MIRYTYDVRGNGKGWTHDADEYLTVRQLVDVVGMNGIITKVEEVTLSPVIEAEKDIQTRLCKLCLHGCSDGIGKGLICVTCKRASNWIAKGGEDNA
jgi:hypothetical protein